MLHDDNDNDDNIVNGDDENGDNNMMIIPECKTTVFCRIGPFGFILNVLRIYVKTGFDNARYKKTPRNGVAGFIKKRNISLLKLSILL